MTKWTSDKIKELRLKSKLTQEKFAAMVGVTTNYVWMLEGGVRKPSDTLGFLLDRIEIEISNDEKEGY